MGGSSTSWKHFIVVDCVSQCETFHFRGSQWRDGCHYSLVKKLKTTIESVIPIRPVWNTLICAGCFMLIILIRKSVNRLLNVFHMWLSVFNVWYDFGTQNFKFVNIYFAFQNQNHAMDDENQFKIWVTFAAGETFPQWLFNISIKHLTQIRALQLGLLPIL